MYMVYLYIYIYVYNNVGNITESSIQCLSSFIICLISYNLHEIYDLYIYSHSLSLFYFDNSENQIYCYQQSVETSNSFLTYGTTTISSHKMR